MGRLIKGEGYLVPKVVLTARQRAAEILTGAALEVEKAHAQAEAAAEQAHREAYALGLREGRAAGAAEVTEILTRARQDADELRAASRDAAIPLARRMAERIVGRALELHPSLIADIALQALAASRARSGPVVLRVNPDDLAALDKERPRLAAKLPTAVDLRFVPDATISRGGCVVETSIAKLDAQLGKQLDALERALDQRLGASRS